jgi:DNA-binding HxlR family transcriptional regulator
MSQPESEQARERSSGGVLVEDLDSRREMLDVATQKTRFTLVQGILSHPQELPSLRELELLNPSLSRTTIHEHLEKLISAGVVERVENAETMNNPNQPSKFYRLTEEGKDVLAGTGLSDAADTLKHYYDQIQKTEEHKRHEAAPRP